MILRSQLLSVIALVGCLFATRAASADPVKYCRFEIDGRVAFGIIEGDEVIELAGDVFGEWERTRRTHSLNEISLLVPTQPRHIFAMAGNYESHLGDENTVTTIITSETKVVSDLNTGETTTETESATEVRRSGQVPEKFSIPQPFFKSPSSLTAHESSIVLPAGAEEVHFEAEMVVVIGREARDVAEEDALDYVFGVTCGNDVSARVWQRNDVQWWRAKASDTFGPCGPYIVSGLDYDDLLMTLRLNGDVKQQERTSHLIHNVSATVSFISRHVTLQPGDLIFTGTPGQTSALSVGDVVEVELEGVGVLRNDVVADDAQLAGFSESPRQVRVEIKDNSVIREHIGGVRSFELDLSRSLDEPGEDTLVFNIRGNKGQGALRADCITIDAEHEDVPRAELILDSGDSYQLFPDDPLN